MSCYNWVAYQGELPPILELKEIEKETRKYLNFETTLILGLLKLHASGLALERAFLLQEKSFGQGFRWKLVQGDQSSTFQIQISLKKISFASLHGETL
jgi:hypothetical protein